MKINIDDFMISIKKKIDSFLETCPLEVLPEFNKAGVTLFIRKYSSGKTYFDEEHFPFDFNIGVKENIFNIKEFLLKNYYPVLTITRVVEREVSAEKKLNLLKKGILDASSVINYKETASIGESYTLVRILQKDRTLHLIRGEEIYCCYIDAPLVYFKSYLLNNRERANSIFNDSVNNLKKLKRGN